MQETQTNNMNSLNGKIYTIKTKTLLLTILTQYLYFKNIKNNRAQVNLSDLQFSFKRFKIGFAVKSGQILKRAKNVTNSKIPVLEANSSKCFLLKVRKTTNFYFKANPSNKTISFTFPYTYTLKELLYFSKEKINASFIINKLQHLYLHICKKYFTHENNH